jgi:hypothetical protein
MTRDDWEGLLDADPADPQRRWEYADYLEEQGLTVEAEVQRWLARTGRRPAPDWTGGWLVSEGAEDDRDQAMPIWDWYSDGFEPHGWWTLPPALFDGLEGRVEMVVWKSYTTRRAAEAALVEAWKKAKAKGWWP